MKKLVRSTVKREKLYKKNFEADSRALIQDGDQEEDLEKFYEPLAGILTLIYKYGIGGSTHDTNEKSSSICKIL